MKAKGRNGWIVVAGYSAWTPSTGDSVLIELSSRRQGRTPPIEIIGTPDEIERLGLTILAAAEEAKKLTPPPCTCTVVGRALAGHEPSCALHQPAEVPAG